MKPKIKPSKILKPRILITCEHADFKIPKFIKSKFPEQYQTMLKNQTHHTFDKFALRASKLLQKNLKKSNFITDLIHYDFTRLIIDANRTPKNKAYYSKISPYLNATELKKTEALYIDYVSQCQTWIQKNIAKGPLYIFSIHSFTPTYKDKVRKTEIGLLFRNNIPKEKALAYELRKSLNLASDAPRTHLNLPYRGSTDCFLNWVLDQHKHNINVNGLFLEFNQNYLQKNLNQKIKNFTNLLLQTLEQF